MDIPWDIIIIQTVNGIVTGMILALVASGLTLIFGIMDVVNFAHGELFMLGAYMGVVTLAATGNFWLALVVATLIIAALGAVLQVVTLRPLLGRDPLYTILATFGISLVLQNYALWQFGPVARKIQEPFSGQFSLFYLQYPWYRLVIAALSAAIIGALWAFLKYGKYGIWIRATTQDRVMAAAMGIPVPLVHTGVFAIGSAMAAASGVLFAPLAAVTQTMGFDFTLRAFIVVVVGGMGNLGGSILAALFISLLEAYAAIVVSPAQAVIVSFIVLVLTMLFRPTGLACRPLLDRVRGGGGAARDRAARAPAVLAALRHGDPDLGAPGDVLRHPYRLHRDGLVRALGVLRPGHVRRRRRAPHHQAAEPRPGGLLRPGRRRRRRRVRRLFRHAAARHLLRHLDPRLLADLLRHHLHLDRGDRRRERAHLPPARAVDPGPRERPLHAHDFSLVRAGGGAGLLPAGAADHPVAIRHGAPVHPRERAAHARDRLSHRALQDRGGDAVRALRRPGRRALRDPEQVRGARLRLLRRVGRGGDLH